MLVCAAIRHLSRAPGVAASLLTLSVLTLAVTAAFVWMATTDYAVLHLWEVTTNALFVASCLCLIVGRLADVAFSTDSRCVRLGDRRAGTDVHARVRVASK